jgi:ribosomal protein L22
MTPDNPQDPPKGKVDETTGKVAEEAAAAKATADAEAAAQPEGGRAPVKRTRAKKSAPEAEGQAAAETGVDKAAAEATEEKPKRTPRAKKQDDEKPAEAKKETTGTRKRDRRPAAQPGVQVQARARYVRTSARKARLVCDHIRGKDVAEARAILAFTPRAAAKPWLKLLESAVANAEHNHELVGEELRIAAVHADEGPTLKRFRPRAMGRATRIRKRTSHLSITLTPKES